MAVESGAGHGAKPPTALVLAAALLQAVRNIAAKNAGGGDAFLLMGALTAGGMLGAPAGAALIAVGVLAWAMAGWRRRGRRRCRRRPRTLPV